MIEVTAMRNGMFKNDPEGELGVIHAFGICAIPTASIDLRSGRREWILKADENIVGELKLKLQEKVKEINELDCEKLRLKAQLEELFIKIGELEEERERLTK